MIGLGRLALALLAMCLFGSGAAKAEWLRAESPNFIVYSEGREARVRQQVAQLEEFDALLRMLTATTAPPSANKLNVCFVRGTTGLRTVANVGSLVAGFYTTSPEGIVAVVDEAENRGENNNQILFHEYAHHFMLQYHPAAYPKWYVEGFAEYVMTARILPDRIEFGGFNQERSDWLSDRDNWVPFERILFEGDRPLSAEDSVRYYAQSWLLVHYLVRDAQRRTQLRAYLAALNRGQDPREAFTAAFGMEASQLGRVLRAYLRDMTFTRGRRTAAASLPNIRITSLPASADEVLTAQAAIRVGVSETRQEELLRRVRRAAARYRDPFSKRVLAHAEILYGTPAAAEPLLEELLAAAPADAELLYLRGLRHLMAGRAAAGATRAGEFRRAQSWFVRAHRADPNHFPTLFRSAESLTTDRRFISENTQNILMLATHLAPQVSEIRLSAAQLLLMRDQFDDAETLLLPLAGATHNSGSAAAAKELLALARRRERPSREDLERMLGKASEESDRD
jgi:tetratricopeptide (TPR) repeat protein